MALDPITDPARVAALWREAGWLHCAALELGAEPSAADDLVQETLISASRGAPTETRSLRRWLRTTLKRRVSMLRRANERRRVREALAAKPESQSGRAADPLASLEADELARVLAEAVAKLPRPDREVLALRYAAGLTPVQISKSLGMTPNAVSSRLSRALKALRERLEQEDRRSLGALLLAFGPVIAMKKTTLVCAAALMAIAALPIARHLMPIEPAHSIEPVLHPANLVDVDPAVDVGAVPAPMREPVPDSRAEVVAAEHGVPAAEVAEVVVEAALGSIHVSVMEAQTGAPAPNVGMHAVRFSSGSFWSQKRALVTDERGEASVSGLTPGSWYLYLDRAAGVGERGVLEAVVEAGGRIELQFKVDREAVIRGRVVDERGSPVAGATLRMTEGGGRVAETFPVAESGEDGRFTIRYAGPTQMVAASAPGYGPSHATCPAILEAVGRPTELILTLCTLRGAIQGYVHDGAGKPIQGAKVAVRSGHGPVPADENLPKGLWHGPPQVDITGADGRFAFADVSVGPATIVARTRASALFSTQIEVAPGLDHEVPVVLRLGGTVQGRVTRANGEPASDYVVRLVERTHSMMSRTEIQTDAHGRYELEHLGPGPVDLIVESDSGADIASEVLEVPEGGSVTWNPAEVRTLEIHGDLHADDGAALRGWYISSRPIVDGQVSGSGKGARTSESGGFSIQPALAETFDVTVYPPGRFFGKPALRLTDYQPDGEALHLTLPRAEMPSAAVHGRLCGPEGEPIAGVVEVVAKEPYTSRELEVGEDGRFQFAFLPETTLEVTLSSGTHPRRSVEISDPLDSDEDRDLGDLLLDR